MEKIMKVLITGIASGIGQATANKFLENNHIVYGIDVQTIESKENLYTYKVDITDEASLINIKQELLNNNVSFDIIINIAGIHKMASLIEEDYSTLKRLIDINLLGTMLVNKTFHPLLKKDGRIIIVTSEVAPLDPMPFNGLYNVSKTALDSYSQALRQELNLIGQKVITIRPGAIKTPLANNSLEDTKRLQEQTILYKKQSHKFYNLVSKFMGIPIEPIKIGKLIYKAGISKNPKLIYQKNRNLGLMLLNILPKRFQCFIIKGLLK